MTNKVDWGLLTDKSSITFKVPIRKSKKWWQFWKKKTLNNTEIQDIINSYKKDVLISNEEIGKLADNLFLLENKNGKKGN